MSQYDLLKTRRFLPLFLTQMLGALNDNIYKNALVIFIAYTLAEQTRMDSSILVIMAGGIFILPFFLFSALAGQIADTLEKSMLIRRIKVAEVLIMSLAIVGFLSESVMVLMTVLFLMGSQSAFFGPLKYGILPQHLELRELTGGNGLIQMATYLAILGGTQLGGVLIAVGEHGREIVSVVVVVVALAGWQASRQIPVAPALGAGRAIDWHLPRQTWVILKQSLADPALFIVIIAISWFWFIGATCLSLVPTYTRDILHGNELVATSLLTAFSIGIGAGSLLCERFSRGHIEPGLVPLGAIGLTLFNLDLFVIGVPGAVTDTAMLTLSGFLSHAVHWRVLLDLVLIGFFGGIYIVPLYAMVQHRSPAESRSRVIAATNILNAVFMVGSALGVIGLLGLGLDIPEVYLVVAVLNLVITGAIFLRYPEYLQQLSALILRRLPQ